MVPTGHVEYINPDELSKNPAFTNVVVVTGSVKTDTSVGRMRSTLRGRS
jgi:hypothetical protein